MKKHKRNNPRVQVLSGESSGMNVRRNNNILKFHSESQTATTASRWVSEPLEIYSLLNLRNTSSLSSKKLQSKSNLGTSFQGREKSRSLSSALGSARSKISMTMSGSLKFRKAANQDVENKFPDEIFVSHMTEVFYYPFLVYWQLMISIIILMMAELIAYNFIYTYNTTILKGITDSRAMYILIFVFNIIYLLDVMLTMVHRLWPEFELKMHFKVRKAGWMLCDCVILIPLLLDSYLFFEYQYILHILQLLAFYRIYFYFANFRNIMGYSVRIVILKMFIVLLLAVLGTSSVLYLYSCVPRTDEPHTLCGKGYFDDIVQQFAYNEETPKDEIQLFLLSQYYAFFVLPPQRSGILFEYLYFPRFFYLVVILAIQLYMYCHILPDLCLQQFLSGQKFNEYCLRRYVITQKLVALKYNEIVVQRIAWFYVYAWSKRMNLEYNIDMHDIPPQLRRNISYDIFYEALAHSDLFRSQDHEFLRIVANQMSSELHMEGDIIYAKNVIKTAMVYVVQGSVEVLSSEDDTTPLLVLGNGTLLGESCLHISYFSNFILRCHSPTCELHVLHKKDFLLLSSRHKKYCRDIMNVIEERFVVGKILNDFSKIINEKLRKTIISREQMVEPTSWLKDTTTRLLDLHYNTGERMSEWMRNLLQLDWWYKLAYHTTDHLMMLGFPKSGHTTSGDPMLLKITFPLIFRPNSKLHDHWDRIVFVLVIILAIMLPYSYSFSCSETRILGYLALLYQCIFVTDIFLQISTGIQTHDGYITDIHRILQHRIQEVGFIIDLLAIVPIFMFAYLLPQNKSHMKRSFQINQLLKLWKVGAFLENKWSARSESHLYMLRFFKFMIYYTFLMYFTCSLFYAFTCYNNCKCLRSTIISSKQGAGLFVNATKLELFICGMYKTTIVFLGDPDIKVTLSTRLEFYFVIFIRLFAAFMQVYVLSCLVQLCVISHEKNACMRTISMSLHAIMVNAGVNQTVKDRAMRFCKKMQMFEEEARDFTKDLPPSFRVETKLTEYVENLIRHPLFLESARDFITSSARMCTTVMIPEKELVINLHHQPEEMFFVKRGFLMVCEGDGVGKIMKPGSGLGVVEVCLDIPYKRTIISITECELIKLTRADFDCARYRIIGMRLGYLNTVETFKEYYLRHKVGSPTEPEVLVKTEIGQNISKLTAPAYRKTNVVGSSVDSKKTKIKRTMYLWRLISFFQIRNTFHPESGFLWWWEISRWFLSALTAMYFPLDFILSHCWLEGGMISIALYVTAAIDIYIRLHIAYYDPETNILITNRMKTASHYYSHGFIIDLFCILPLEIIPESKRVIKLLMRYNKVLSVYRLKLGLSMLAERYHKHRQMIYFFQYLVILLVLSNALAVLLIVLVCRLGRGINQKNSYWSTCMICDKEGWPRVAREFGMENNFMSAFKLYYLSLYWASSMLTCNSLPFVYARTIGERTIALFTVLVGGYLSFHYITMIIAHGIDGYVNLRKYQTKVAKLIIYLEKKKIPKYVVRLVKHHVYVNWVVRQNSKIEDILKNFPRPLQSEIMLHIYFNALSKNVILAYTNYSFFEKLFSNVKSRLYVKNCNIILSGDVISSVYFLVEGVVEIYDQNDAMMKEAGPGSIFGVIEKSKYQLVDYSVLAKSTVQVLVIPSLDLHNKVLPVEPYLMKALTASKIEFEKLLIPVAKKSSVLILDDDDRAYGPTEETAEREYHPKWHRNILHKVNEKSNLIFVLKTIVRVIYFNLISLWFEQMVFFSWGSCVLYFYTSTTCDTRFYMFFVFYLLDILKCLNIIVLLKKMKRKRMFYSLSGFFTGSGGILFNIIMVLPYEILFFLILGVTHFTFLLRANRLISLQFLIKYWKFKCKKALEHPLATNISYKCAYCLLLFFSLGIVTLTSFIYFLHNWERNFSYSDLSNRHKGIQFVGVMAFLVGIRRPIISDGDSNDYPISKITFLVAILLALTRAIFITIFFTFFYVCVFDKRFIYPQYWHRYNKLMAFLKDANTTSSLFLAAKRHMELFWQQNEGFQQPELFPLLPYHLRAAINNYAYGKYIYFSELFSGCSLNFLRQVAACLEPMTLYSSDTIVATGTCDSSMYFIISGVVVVNDVSADTTIDVLYKWDSFGHRQGLSTARHEFDYVAYSQILILRLNFSDWEYLVPFYEYDFLKITRNLKNIQSRDHNLDNLA